MLRIITSSRGRASAVSIVGAALQVAVQVVLGAWRDSDPLFALAAGLLVAVLAGLVGGLVSGAVASFAGAVLFVALGTADREVAAITVPAWLAAGLAAGFASDRWMRVGRRSARAEADLDAIDRASPAALVSVGLDDTILHWNAEARRVFEPLGDEATDRSASILGAEIAELAASVRAGGGLAEGRVDLASGDGRALRLLVRALPYGRLGEEAVLVAAVDVSEAVERADEVRELTARHEALLRNLPVVTYAHPAGDRRSLTYVSPQLKALLGYAPEDVIGNGDGLARLVHPEDRGRVEDELRTAAAHGPLRSEYRMLARDGRVVPVRDEATTVRDPTGQPLYVQGFLVDLSDRLEFQRERERLALARREASSEALTTQKRLDLAVEVGELLASATEVETALRRVAELAVRDFADWCVVDLVTNDGDLSRLTAAHAEGIRDVATRAAAPEPVPALAVRAVAERGQPLIAPSADAPGPAEIDESASSPDSRILAPMVARGHTLGVLSFVRRAGGRPYVADDLALATDITRRTALAVDTERLRDRVEEEADAARVLAYVADGVFLVDRTGVIRLWNPAAEAITGFPAASMIGRRPAEAIRGWESIREQIPVASPADPAQPHTVSLEAGERELWLSISAVEFFGGTVYAFRDITAVHHLEELKGEFVATASHELRTPLAAVYGAAQTLRRHDFALDEAGRERFVTMIVDEADRLSRIVNEILLATQLDAGGLDLATEPFDPSDLVNRVAEATRSHVRAGISLNVVAPSPLPEVTADRDKVRQVLVNLIDNAVKYSPDGGDVEIGVAAANGTVRFYVRDGGLGIPAAEQKRIFEKFYRLDPAMTRGVGGTGLGLYICHELVRRMGGRIWVESKQGEGSTFSFELPAAAASRPVAAARAGPGGARAAEPSDDG